MKPYLLMLLSVGFIWLRSSVGKFTGGTFVDTLAGTLGKFASNNPYAWYKNYLQIVAIPNAKTIGMVIMWSEFLAAISITGAILYLLFGSEKNKIAQIILLIGLIGGMILNANFWLAAGWMSPSTESVNLLMFLIQGVGFMYGIKKITAEK